MPSLLASIDTAKWLYIIAGFVFLVVFVIHLVDKAIVSAITVIGFALIAFGLWQSITP